MDYTQLTKSDEQAMLSIIGAETVDELFAGLKDNILNSYASLIELRDDPDLPESIKQDIADRLAAYHSITKA